MTGDAVQSVRSQATEIARGWSSPGAPPSWALTARIFSILADDDELLAVAARIPAERMPALIFSAATRYLIFEHDPTPLSTYFPTPGEAQRALDERFESAFKSFCLEHRSEILTLGTDRLYQMNEVARSTEVALALGLVAKEMSAEAVALIDVGTGAGLGLYLDCYGHQLDPAGAFGDLTSSLVLRCQVNGPWAPPVPTTLPAIERRTGIDLNPLDVADPNDLRWARACLPPEIASLERFDEAVRVVLGHQRPILHADALEVLPSILDAVPGHLLPVVVDAYTAVFFSDEQLRRLFRSLRQVGASRDLAWISLDPLIPLGTEGRYSVQDLHVEDDLVNTYQRGGVFALLGVLAFDQGEEVGGLLACAHPSGTSITWLESMTDVFAKRGPTENDNVRE